MNNKKMNNKKLVLRSTKMKSTFDIGAFLSTLQNIQNFYKQVSPPLPYNPEYQRSQTFHHIRTVDENDKCFKVTVNGLNSYNVEILRSIELFHDISIPGGWGGNIKVTINKNWGISLSFSTPDGWIQNNQWIYGRLWFKSGSESNESGPDESLSLYTKYKFIIGYVNNIVYSASSYPIKNCIYDDAARNYPECSSYQIVTLNPFKIFEGSLIYDGKETNIEVSSPNLSSSTKTFVGDNPPMPNEKYFLHDPNDHSIYVLRYQVFLIGYYGGKKTSDMRICISGDLKVKLPGFFKNNDGYSYLPNPIITNPQSIPTGLGS